MQGQAGRLVVATELLRSPDDVVGQKTIMDFEADARSESEVLSEKECLGKDVNVLSSRHYCRERKIWG